MKKDLHIIIGQPFEEDWQTEEYSLFDKDQINPEIPFIFKNSDGEVVLDLMMQKGLTVAQFEGEETCRVVLSIYETEVLEAGEYTYEYYAATLGGKKIIDLEGSVLVEENVNLDTKKERAVRPWDLLRSSKTPEGARVSEEIHQERYDICKSCPEFISLTKQCKLCGCLMNQKTKLSAASCPIEKWLPVI